MGLSDVSYILLVELLLSGSLMSLVFLQSAKLITQYGYNKPSFFHGIKQVMSSATEQYTIDMEKLPN